MPPVAALLIYAAIICCHMSWGFHAELPQPIC